MPGPGAAAAQLALSCLDWTLAATVLWVLLPAGRVEFLSFAGAFMTAQVLGLVSHVPGGLGVFETVLVVLCKPALSAGDLLPALVALSSGVLPDPFRPRPRGPRRRRGMAAARRRRSRGVAVRTAAREIIPRLLAALASSPERCCCSPEPHRPSPGVSAGSTVSCRSRSSSVALRGKRRRCRAAPALPGHSPPAGRRLLPHRRRVERGPRLLDPEGRRLRGGGAARPAAPRSLGSAGAVRPEAPPSSTSRFSPSWTSPAGAWCSRPCCSGSSRSRTWSTRPSLWWQFALRADASRFLRASVGACVALLAFGLGRLLRLAPRPRCVRPATRSSPTRTG